MFGSKIVGNPFTRNREIVIGGSKEAKTSRKKFTFIEAWRAIGK